MPPRGVDELFRQIAANGALDLVQFRRPPACSGIKGASFVGQADTARRPVKQPQAEAAFNMADGFDTADGACPSNWAARAKLNASATRMNASMPLTF
jgi:hypothetical protein